MMKQLVQNFPAQLRHALQIGEAASVSFAQSDFRNVVIAGMGGSGIGGNLVQSIVCDEIKIPVYVSKYYRLPAFVDENTLFIASSFSGNTEETLICVKQALERKAIVACITSGGELLEIAQKHGLPFIQIPGDSKSPRACLGYSLVQMLVVLNKAGLLSDKFLAEIRVSAEMLSHQQQMICDKAEALAEKFFGRFPIIYSDNRFEPVAVRSQQQINENSKQLSHVNTFPEMNHNELVGWVFPEEVLSNSVVVLLRSSLDHSRVKLRMDFCKPVFAAKAASVLDLPAQGHSYLEQALYFIHLFDWVSVYLAERNDTDPVPVNAIDTLKKQMAEA